MVRRGFTLIELLIVIGVIAVLMGLLFPAIGMVKDQANAVRCGNNLRQIALAIEVYRQNHDEGFPGKLAELLADGFAAKSFLCPFDTQKGSDRDMGRKPYEPVDQWGNYQRLWEQGSSYCYEASGHRDVALFTDSDNPGAGMWSDIAYFYRDLPAAQRPVGGSVSWADGKLHQQKFGNLANAAYTDNRRWGMPFPASSVPIVRCYWHAPWRTMSKAKQESTRKVNNISLAFNVSWSVPYWEKEVTPNIDP